ncbi:hypothetical protein ACVWZZ_004123 [Bradyrhizobium sp. LM6.10]
MKQDPVSAKHFRKNNPMHRSHDLVLPAGFGAIKKELFHVKQQRNRAGMFHVKQQEVE